MVGPTKIAADLEDNVEASARQIEHEFNVVVNIVAPRGTRRDCVGVGVARPTANRPTFILNMSYEDDDGVTRSFSRAYRTEEQARPDVDILRAMLRDPDWAWCSTPCVWMTWLVMVAGDVEASEWLAGYAHIPGLQAVVLRRTLYKNCGVPAVEQGCHREDIGQVCARTDSTDGRPLVADAIAAEQAVAAALDPHHGALSTASFDMAGPRDCVAHFIRGKAKAAQPVRPTVLAPERADNRLAVVYDLDPVMVWTLFSARMELASDRPAPLSWLRRSTRRHTPLMRSASFLFGQT